MSDQNWINHSLENYSPYNFYIRKEPRNIDWRMINYPFSKISNTLYDKIFCKIFSTYDITRDFTGGRCDHSNNTIRYYSIKSVNRALRSLRSKNICTKTPFSAGHYIRQYRFKNPLESNLYNIINIVAFKF